MSTVYNRQKQQPSTSIPYIENNQQLENPFYKNTNAEIGVVDAMGDMIFLGNPEKLITVAETQINKTKKDNKRPPNRIL